MGGNRTSDFSAIFRGVAVLRSRELTARGFSRQTIANAAKRGIIRRIGRGLYTAKNAPLTGKRSYVEVARKAPKAVFCLLSACRLQEITAQDPRKIWIAIGPKAWSPQITSVKTHVVRFSGAALSTEIETQHHEGTEIKVYSVAKTIADLFRYRNKFGVEIALEALREALKKRKCSVNQIKRCARLRGVWTVVEPHLIAHLAQYETSTTQRN